MRIYFRKRLPKIMVCLATGEDIRNKQKIRTLHQSGKCSDYLFLVGEGGFEPPKSLTTDLQSAPFGRSGILPYMKMELVDGLEPPTC